MICLSQTQIVTSVFVALMVWDLKSTSHTKMVDYFERATVRWQYWL